MMYTGNLLYGYSVSMEGREAGNGTGENTGIRLKSLNFIPKTVGSCLRNFKQENVIIRFAL